MLDTGKEEKHSMVTFNDVQAQIVGAGSNAKCLTVQQIKQLARELSPNEQIMSFVKGWYQGSVGLLCATDKRLLILTKDTDLGDYNECSYSHITDTVHNDRGFSTTITFYLGSEHLDFRSWRVNKMKDLYTFTKRHIMYIQDRDKKIEEAMSLSITMKAPAKYEARSWRALLRRVGNASIVS